MMSLAHSWIAIIGVPLHNQEKLPHRADDYISNSEIIVGAERHRARVAHHNRPYKQWQKPFADNDTLFSRHRTIAILASGDPSFFGVAQFVRRHAQKHTVIVLPAVSSLESCGGAHGMGDGRYHLLFHSWSPVAFSSASAGKWRTLFDSR